MESLNICFLARPCYDVFSAKIYAELKRNFDSGVIGHFITSNAEESDYIKNSLGSDNVFIHEVSSYFKAHWDEFTKEDLIRNEKKYECAPVWEYIYMDRFLINRDYEYAVKIADGYFRFFEEIFQSGEIDFYYDEVIATLQSYVAYIVANKYGATYLSQAVARGGIDLEYHYFVSDPFEIPIDFPKDYLNIDYSEEELKRADEFLKENEEKEVIPASLLAIQKKPKLNVPYLLTAPLHYLKAYMKPKNHDKYFYMYYHEAGVSLDTVKFYFNYRKSKKYYQEPDYSEKFVYFPLHYQPEASTIVCAQKYEKQLYFIDSWAKSLPADTKLYVKEHYFLLGNRDPKFFENLKQYPNVKVISPFVSSRELIDHCEALATLTGTAGWEAMLQRKPVFLSGRVFFENAPGIIRQDEVYLHYLDAMAAWKKPSREDLIKYICAFFRIARKGNAHAEMTEALTDDNIHLISKSLFEKMQEIGKNKYHAESK